MIKRLLASVVILCMLLTMLQGIMIASAAEGEWQLIFSDNFEKYNNARPSTGGATYKGVDKWSTINHDSTYDTLCVTELGNVIAKLHSLDNSAIRYPNMRKCVDISKGKIKLDFKLKCDPSAGVFPNILLRSQSGTQVPLVTSTSDGKLRFGYGAGLVSFDNTWQTISLEYTASSRELYMYLTNSAYTNKKFGPYSVAIPDGFDVTDPLVVFQMAIPKDLALTKACGYFDDVAIYYMSTSSTEIVESSLTSLLAGDSNVLPQEEFGTSSVITRAGAAQATIRIKNSLGKDIAPAIITAIYEGDKCAYVNITSVDKFSTGASKDVPVNFTIPEGIENGKVKFLVWDNTTDMNEYTLPISKNVVTQRALNLPNVFEDGMVLQRDKKVKVFGEAPKDAQITVTFDGKTATATATEGRFIAEFDEVFSASTTPKSLVVTSSTGEAITVNDVLVGDVLVGGGQSNMAMTFDSNLQKIPHPATVPANMRWFKLNSGSNVSDVGKRYDPANGNYASKENWQNVTTGNVGGVSAVMYFAAEKMLKTNPDVPVGIIVNAWGGTVIHQWISPDVVKKNIDNTSSWWRTQYADRVNVISSIPYSPVSGLYHYQTATIMPYTAKAFVWYHGESNSSTSFNYHLICKELIDDYRIKWQDPDLPVFIVQLPGWLDSKWAPLRLKQAWLEENVDNTYLVVTNDTGDDRTVDEVVSAGYSAGQHTSVTVHPTDKQPIGDRIARSIMANLDGKSIPYAGPVYAGMTGKGQTEVTINYTNFNEGLVCSAADSILTGFEVSTDGNDWTAANATIVGDSVVLTSEAAINYVRYGYVSGVLKSLGSKAEEGAVIFPAAPFRTDGKF